MEGAEGMFNGMFRRTAGNGFHKSGIGIGQSHIGARLQVIPVIHGARKIFGNVFNGLEREHVPHGRGDCGHISLHGMKQGVKSLVCR